MTTYTKASQVSADVADRIKNVQLANGCETDIGRTVFRGRRNVDKDMVPCAVIIEGDDRVVAKPGRLPSVLVRQRFVIGCYVPCDPDHPNDAAHAAIRDVKRAMFAGDTTLGGRVVSVSYGGRDIGPRADGFPVVFATVYIDVEYAEDLTNP